MSYRNYGVATGFVVDPGGHGDFKTITSALAAATVGGLFPTIYLSPGTYSESFTLIPGIALASFVASSQLNVTILGNITINPGSAAGDYSLSGIILSGTSGYTLNITAGSAVFNVTLQNCYLSCTESSGINFTATGSAPSTSLRLFNCQATVGGTGAHTLLTTNTNSSVFIQNCRFQEFVGTTPPYAAISSQNSPIQIENSYLEMPLSATGSGSFYLTNCRYEGASAGTPFLTTAGSSTSYVKFCDIDSGSSFPLNIGSGTAIVANKSTINTSAASITTGTGNFLYDNLSFSGTGNSIYGTPNVTEYTQTVGSNSAYFHASANGNYLVAKAPMSGILSIQIIGAAYEQRIVAAVSTENFDLQNTNLCVLNNYIYPGGPQAISDIFMSHDSTNQQLYVTITVENIVVGGASVYLDFKSFYLTSAVLGNLSATISSTFHPAGFQFLPSQGFGLQTHINAIDTVNTSAGNFFLPNGNTPPGTPSAGGILYVSAGALHYLGTSGTNTVIAPA